MRLQLIVPQNSMIQPEIFNRLLSTAPVTLVVLVAVPLALGLIAYIAPLQIGARGVALRLHQFSYWLYLVGGVTIYASFLWAAPESGRWRCRRSPTPSSPRPTAPTHGSPAPRWPRSASCASNQPGRHPELLRAPGLAWRRMPLFSWAAAVVGWLLVVTGPMMIAAPTTCSRSTATSTGLLRPCRRAARRSYTNTSPTSTSRAPT